MKSHKYLLICAISLTISCFNYAQISLDAKIQDKAPERRTLELHKKALMNSKYVFEGIVIKQEAYANKKGESRTCTVFNIEKIFKGSGLVHLGTIKVITNQGRGLIDGGPAIGNGRYIIVGIPTDSSNLKTPAFDTDNSAIPSVEALIEIGRDSYLKGKKIHHDTPVIWLGSQIDCGTLYHTIEDLYGFFKENGLTVEVEIKQAGQKNGQGDSLKH